jgi:transcriptional regulator with XRE-family HTH domain
MASTRWADVRAEMTSKVGGEEAVAEAREERLAEEAGYKLAELRKALKLTQKQVAERMGVTKGRVSQVERGLVSTQDVLARYAEALGGRLQQAIHFPGGDIAVITRVTTSATAAPAAKKKATPKSTVDARAGLRSSSAAKRGRTEASKRKLADA